MVRAVRMEHLQTGPAGKRILVAALFGVSVCFTVLVYRAGRVELLGRAEVVALPLRYMYQPAMPMLKGLTYAPTVSTASIAFNPGVEVNYPGYMPPDDPRGEGSDAMTFEPWARNAEMRKRAGWDVGETGWEPGPDYYSTRKYDNLEVYPSSRGSGSFRPYMGPTACPNCETKVINGSYMFSVNSQCDRSIQTRNIKAVLKPYDPFKGTAFENRRYEDLVWNEQQLQLLKFFFNHLTILIPPCFFPHFSSKAMAKLDDLVYMRGTNLLIVGGHSGADFISRFLAGEDGYGYVKSWHRDEYALPKSRIDVVWTEGPFVMQEAAVATEFMYGHRILRNVGNCIVGVPVKDLPANTKYYYMDQDENAVIFEIPAGHGRVLFFGYDMCSMAPEWIDTLLLAQSELMTRQLPAPPPEGPYIPLPPPPLKPPPTQPRPSAPASGPVVEDMPTGLNYYCALYKRNKELGAPGALLDKYLKKCQSQDCDNNRALDDNDSQGVVDFCKWMDEFGHCYLKQPATWCYRHPDDARCYCHGNCGEARTPKYGKYDPTCGGKFDPGGYECYGSQCAALGYQAAKNPHLIEGGAVEGGAVEGGAVEGGAVEGGAEEGGAEEGFDANEHRASDDVSVEHSMEEHTVHEQASDDVSVEHSMEEHTVHEQGPEYVIVEHTVEHQAPENVIVEHSVEHTVEHEARQDPSHSAQLQQTPRWRVKASAAASAAASLDFNNKMQKAAEIAERQEEY